MEANFEVNYSCKAGDPHIEMSQKLSSLPFTLMLCIQATDMTSNV